MQSKKTLVSILTVAVMMGGSLFGTGQVFAQTPTPTSHPNFFSGLIQYIAQKFGLDQNQVKAAVTTYQTQQKQTRQANIEQREQTRLDLLVKEGKITADQEKAILAELASLKSKYPLDTTTKQTPAERKTQMTNMMNDLKSWATTNNIDEKYVMPGFGMRKGMRGGRGFGKGINPTPTPTP